jgi:hypothetical protein
MGVFGGISVAHLFNFLCCVFSVDCLRPVSCVPNVVSFIEDTFKLLVEIEEALTSMPVTLYYKL